MPDDADNLRDRLAAWYDVHAVWMHRYAVMLTADAPLAEDAVQQVFAKLAGMGKELARVNTERSYLRQAVRRTCYDLLALRTREASGVGAVLEPVAEASEPEDPGLREELEAGLRSLPPEQREVVHLKVYEGLTFAEIGQVTGVSADTAASRYRYALEKLRRILGAMR